MLISKLLVSHPETGSPLIKKWMQTNKFVWIMRNEVLTSRQLTSRSFIRVQSTSKHREQLNVKNQKQETWHNAGPFNSKARFYWFQYWMRTICKQKLTTKWPTIFNLLSWILMYSVWSYSFSQVIRSFFPWSFTVFTLQNHWRCAVAKSMNTTRTRRPAFLDAITMRVLSITLTLIDHFPLFSIDCDVNPWHFYTEPEQNKSLFH